MNSHSDHSTYQNSTPSSKGELAMLFRCLDSQEIQRVKKLSESPYRPVEIRKLTEKIEGQKRVAELHASITGQVDEAQIAEIVQMRYQLDALYMKWVSGEIS